MTRLEATRSMTGWFGDRAVIASLGHPAYDLFAAGDRPAGAPSAWATRHCPGIWKG